MKVKTLSIITAIVTIIGVVISFILNMVNGFYWDSKDYLVYCWSFVLSCSILVSKFEDYVDD